MCPCICVYACLCVHVGVGLCACYNNKGDFYSIPLLQKVGVQGALQ